MAIKTVQQETVPSVNIEYLQFSRFNMSVSQKPPYRINVTAIVHPYGKDSDGKHLYSGAERSISITDLVAYVGTLDAADQVIAASGMQKINEGLGALAEVMLNIEFVEYEA